MIYKKFQCNRLCGSLEEEFNGGFIPYMGMAAILVMLSRHLDISPGAIYVYTCI